MDADPVRLLLVDDHPAVREGLALLLAPAGVSVCAEAGSVAGALAGLESCPDVALVDLSLGEEDGMSLVSELRARGTPVLVYSMHEDGAYVGRALSAGARGYVTKREMHRVLVEAIRAVVAGRQFLGPRAAEALAAEVARAGERDVARRLSEQERRAYELLGDGAATAEIAAVLRVSSRTVETYYVRMMQKLGVEGMQALRRQAIRDLRDRMR